jgi:hypothetical protein
MLAASATRLNRASVDFLKIDLQTALTFTGIALQNEADAAKRRRNQENARKGYDTILRLMEKVSLTADDSCYISSHLKRLKGELSQLGETF